MSNSDCKEVLLERLNMLLFPLDKENSVANRNLVINDKIIEKLVAECLVGGKTLFDQQLIMDLVGENKKENIDLIMAYIEGISRAVRNSAPMAIEEIRNILSRTKNKRIKEACYKILRTTNEPEGINLLRQEAEKNTIARPLTPEGVFIQALSSSIGPTGLEDLVDPEWLSCHIYWEPSCWKPKYWRKIPEYWGPLIVEKLVSNVRNDKKLRTDLIFDLLSSQYLTKEQLETLADTVANSKEKMEFITTLSHRPLDKLTEPTKEALISFISYSVMHFEGMIMKYFPIITALGVEYFSRILKDYLFGNRGSKKAVVLKTLFHELDKVDQFEKEDIYSLTELLLDKQFIEIWEDVVDAVNMLDASYLKDHIEKMPRLVKALVNDNEARSQTLPSPNIAKLQELLERRPWQLIDCKEILETLRIANIGMSTLERALSNEVSRELAYFLATYNATENEKEWLDLVEKAWEEIQEFYGSPWEIFRWSNYSLLFIKVWIDRMDQDYKSVCRSLILAWRTTLEHGLNPSAKWAKEILMDYLSRDAKFASELIEELPTQLRKNLVQSVFSSQREVNEMLRKLTFDLANYDYDFKMTFIARITDPLVSMEQISARPYKSTLGQTAESEISARLREWRMALRKLDIYEVCPLGESRYDPTIHELSNSLTPGSNVIVVFAGFRFGEQGEIIKKARIIPGESD